MPSTKGFLDNVKTTSYHVDVIQGVRQAKKAPSTVKITVSQDGANKTYDFEAENETTAGVCYVVRREHRLISYQRPLCSESNLLSKQLILIAIVFFVGAAVSNVLFSFP